MSVSTVVNMRLSSQQISQIKQTIASVLLNDTARVTLFGSRVDDNAKGGDIDLLVETSNVHLNRASMASKIAASLQIKLGDQRIDVLLVDPETPFQPIHDQARQQGAEL